MLRKITSKAIFVGLLSPAAAFASNSCEQVMDVNFDAYSSNKFTPYTTGDATKDFGTLGKNAAGKVRGLETSVKGKKWKAKNTVGNGVLKAHYPKMSSGGKVTGFLFDKTIKPSSAAIMEYRFKLSKGFEAKAGGKLPGLGGYSNAANIPVGCTTNKDSIYNGFSARMMWRNNNKLVAYTYFPNRTEKGAVKCGIDETLETKNSETNRMESFQLEDDTWYTLRQYVQLNDPKKKNGKLKVEINGVTMLDLDDVQFRVPDPRSANSRNKGKKNRNSFKTDGSQVMINNVVMHTYRGGSPTNTKFFASKDSHIEFDDFKVWRDCTSLNSVTKPVVKAPAKPESSKPVKGSGVSQPYFETPVSIPGTIEAEYYNRGGQGVTYNDTNPQNSGRNVARENEGVDITRTLDGGMAIGWISKDEWVEYTVDVKHAAKYAISAVASATVENAQIQMLLDGKTLFNDKPIEMTGGYNVYKENNLVERHLSKGKHVLRVKFLSRSMNLDKLYIEEVIEPVSVQTPSQPVPKKPTITDKVKDLISKNTPKKPVSKNCTVYRKGARQEVVLTGNNCVVFPMSLTGKNLAIWDSNTNAGCDFRGTVTAGGVTTQVTSNYVKLTALKGEKATFKSNNNCPYVKVRAY